MKEAGPEIRPGYELRLEAVARRLLIDLDDVMGTARMPIIPS